MKRQFTLTLIVASTITLVAACSNKDPRLLGTEAGHATCDCYRLPTQEATAHCLDSIDNMYAEYLTDTAFTNARESATLECVNDGVLDLEKPIRDLVPEPVPADSNATAE